MIEFFNKTSQGDVENILNLNFLIVEIEFTNLKEISIKC